MKMNQYGMAFTTIALGLALNLVGIISWILAGENASFTTLIPNVCGGIFIILGGLAFKADLRKHVMHAALAVALLLAVMTGYMAVNELIQDDGNARKLFAFETTAGLCIAFIAIGVRSFIHARKMRRAANRANHAADAAAV